MLRKPITNFSKGEFGPALYGRLDIPQYEAGAKQLTNWLIQRYGGIFFRPGWQFVGKVDDSADQHLLIPFQYNIDQAYVLVAGDYQMRIVADGGQVLEDNLKILSVQIGAETTLEVSFHEVEVGDLIYIDGVDAPDELNNRFATVTAIPDDSHVTVDIDSREFVAFTSSDGEDRSAPPAAPPAAEPPPVEVVDTPDPPPTGAQGDDLGSVTPGTGTWHAQRFTSVE